MTILNALLVLPFAMLVSTITSLYDFTIQLFTDDNGNEDNEEFAGDSDLNHQNVKSWYFFINLVIGHVM